jgi:hypothetical protein
MLSARQKPNKLNAIARKGDLKIIVCEWGERGERMGEGGGYYPYKT